MSWTPGTKIEVRIVTEDSSADAHDTIAHLLRRMTQLVEPSFATNRLATLRQVDPKERLAAQPHRWGSGDSKDRLHVKMLARTIAADLVARRFVLVHADGDTLWSKRPGRHVASFQNHLTPVVRQALIPDRAEPRRPGRAQPAVEPRPEEEIERCLAHLILIMPYYTIEAWLYQNTEVAVRLCREKYQGRDIEKLLRWQQERARLDDKEKEDLQICLGKEHNLELASSSYPAQAAFDAGASFHAAVEAVRACAELRAALAAP